MRTRQLRFQYWMGRLLQAILVAWFCPLISTASAGNILDECFCLQHPLSGNKLRGCISYERAPPQHTIAVCTDPVTGKKSKQEITIAWERIDAGADGCNPCRRQVRRTTDEVPRGEGNTPSTASPQLPEPKI